MCEVPKVYLQRRNSSNTENGPIRMPKTPRKPKNSPHRVALRRKKKFYLKSKIELNFSKDKIFINRQFQMETVPFNQKLINLFRPDVEASLVPLQNHQNPNLSMICLQVHQPLRSQIGLQSPELSKSDVLLTETFSNIRKTRHFLNFLARNQVKNANENRRCFKVLPL